MKRKELEWLINRLKNEVDDDHFIMNRWLAYITRVDGDPAPYYSSVAYFDEDDIPHCRTAGCIAGTYFLGLTPQQRQLFKGGLAAVRAAKHGMGLNDDEATVLFEPIQTASIKMQEITRQQAVAMLERILTHSVIDWPSVINPSLVNHLIPMAKTPFPVTLT